MVTVKKGVSDLTQMANWVQFVWAVNSVEPLIRHPIFLGHGVEVYAEVYVLLAPELDEVTLVPRTLKAKSALGEAAAKWKEEGKWIERS